MILSILYTKFNIFKYKFVQIPTFHFLASSIFFSRIKSQNMSPGRWNPAKQNLFRTIVISATSPQTNRPSETKSAKRTEKGFAWKTGSDFWIRSQFMVVNRSCIAARSGHHLMAAAVIAFLVSTSLKPQQFRAEIDQLNLFPHRRTELRFWVGTFRIENEIKTCVACLRLTNVVPWLNWENWKLNILQ